MDVLHERAYVLGPRIPVLLSRDDMMSGTKTLQSRGASRVMAAREETTSCSDPNLCQKPYSSINMTVPITVVVVVIVVAALGVLLYLHRRNVKKVRKEDATDPHKSLDFGLGDTKSKNGKGDSEKNSRAHYNRQMSMDLNLSNPYLLPPGLHSSRESLHSLARTLHQNEDPYRPVAQYANSDAGSIRSLPRGGSSIHTGSTKGNRNSRTTFAPSVTGIAPPRQNSFPKSPSPLSPLEPAHMKSAKNLDEKSGSPPPPSYNDHFVGHAEPIAPQVLSIPYSETKAVEAPSIQEPPAGKNLPRKASLPSPAAASPADSAVALGYGDKGFEMMPQREVAPVSAPANKSGFSFGLDPMAEPQQAEIHTMSPPLTHAVPAEHGLALAPPPIQALPASPRPVRKQEPQPTMPVVEEPLESYDYVNMPEIPQGEEQYEARGRNMQRQSHLYQQEGAQGGLGVPQQDNRRLSVGFRPLPPDEIMESEDPEYRANRIRSFYKEYFEESKPTEPMPAIPAQYGGPGAYNYGQAPQGGHGGVDYYEDYDAGYMGGEAAYFDPDSNAFVMPYAQPVSRRAMTPPPSGQRFPGPRGPSRGPPMGPPRHFSGGPGSRPGSSASSRMGPRPGSSVSNNAWGRPRAGSTMSGGRFGPPRKAMPPPAALNTLPTPSKLKDDSFALMNAMDFAPPESFGSRARGRSQSPLGERKPYKPSVPVHSPLVNAFDELAGLPSPHLLRKSSTFTGLDFAPPRKFVDNDTRSDAGSIRSNRSGISQAQLSAIRGGAGRVSRLPGDTIFTQVDMGEKLKPQWTMRD